MKIEAEIADGVLIFRVPYRIEAVAKEPEPALHEARRGLTSAELEVFEMLRRGKANKEIASALNLGQRTVKFHVSGIFRKLGCSSRGELIFKYGGGG